ncbi:MAG: rhodanese-like domain-containing protein [Thermoanaerobaculia bacterium]|jgi:thiosulfate/3-mercaptopyruvate sulfurtransferase
MSFLILVAMMAVTPQQDVIVTTEWLAAHLNDPNVVLVEIGKRSDFDNGHIPGARFIASDQLVVNKNGIPDEMPAVANLERLFGNAGVGNYGRIVLYSREPLLATRAFFTLDYLGHGNRIAVLDGGYPLWRNEKGMNRPVTKATTKYRTEVFTAAVDPGKLLTIDDVRMAASTGMIGGENVVIVDARPATQYIGKDKGRQVSNPGHIAAANCAPWTINYTDVVPAKFKTADELMVYYNLRGINENAKIVLYCRTGMEATATFVALRYLGFKNVALYDGSYVEWNKTGDVVMASVAAPQ